MQFTKQTSWPRIMIISQGTMNRMYQAINAMKAIDTSASSTIVMEDLEIEDDSLEIVTVNHDDQSNVLHAIKKDTGMRILHIKT